ncbi:hypothetical protein Q4S25_21600, partial [Morganella morganii]
ALAIHQKASLTYCELVLVCTKVSLRVRKYNCIKIGYVGSVMINTVISDGKDIILSAGNFLLFLWCITDIEMTIMTTVEHQIDRTNTFFMRKYLIG